MKLIGDFLSRFTSLTPPNDAVKGAVVDAVQHVVGARVLKKDVRIQNGTAFVTGSSIMKNTLRVKRSEVLDALYAALPQSRDTIRDVR